MGGAQAGELYIGGGFGSASADDASTNAAARVKSQTLRLRTNSANVSSSASYDDSGGTGYSVLAGYRFTSYLSAEAAYDYLGKYNFQATFVRSGVVITRTEQNEVSAFSVSGLLTIPIEKLAAIYGKVGVAATTDKMTCSISNGTCNSESDVSKSGMAGIGGILVLGNGEVRLEYDQFQDVGDKNNEYTAGTFSLLKLEYVHYFSLEKSLEDF